MLRLVRDEPAEWTQMEEQDVQADADSAEMGRPERGEDEEQEQREATNGEAPDGAVEGDAQDAEQSSADQAAVNLGAMEAMLMSTHHPLTAGRLAEMLDLDTTKPLRKAIKELNAQYE